MASSHHRVKSGKKGAAANHSNYIARRGRFGSREDLLDTGHGNLPYWAEDEPIAFWRAADKYERANGASYREHEIALPEELTLEQQHELVLGIVRDVIGPRPFEYAIHRPKAAIGNGMNLHVHLMYSDRLPDGIQRTAETTFKRFCPGAPKEGGCRKASGGRNRMQLRDELIAVKRICAALQNEALARHGHDARVDHRSLKDRGIMRAAERRLGPAKMKAMTEEERNACRRVRARLGNKKDV